MVGALLLLNYYIYVIVLQVLPNLTTKKRGRVDDLQRKLAEHESSRLQQLSNDLTSANIPKHLDIKVWPMTWH